MHSCAKRLKTMHSCVKRLTKTISAFSISIFSLLRFLCYHQWTKFGTGKKSSEQSVYNAASMAQEAFCALFPNFFRWREKVGTECMMQRVWQKKRWLMPCQKAHILGITCPFSCHACSVMRSVPNFAHWWHRKYIFPLKDFYSTLLVFSWHSCASFQTCCVWGQAATAYWEIALNKFGLMNMNKWTNEQMNKCQMNKFFFACTVIILARSAFPFIF